MSPPLHVLANRIASGDAEAFSCLYERCFDQLMSEAKRTSGGDESTCLDLVQEGLLRMIRKRPRFTHDAAVRAWLRTTIQRCALDHLRREVTRQRYERRSRQKLALPADNEHREQHARLQWLHRELSQLDDESRRLLSLRFRLGLTLKQVGRAVGISGSAADGRLRRILQALRQRAEEHMHV